MNTYIRFISMSIGVFICYVAGFWIMGKIQEKSNPDPHPLDDLEVKK